MHDHDHLPTGTSEQHRPARAAPTPDLHVMRAAGAGRPDVLGPSGMLQLQRLAGNDAAGELLEAEPERSPVLDVVGSGGGQPMETGLRRDMESRLGSDFSDVRIHTDTAATASAQAVNAHAYTVGSNVVFQRDRYDPASTAGRTMLAHELTHVVQQRSGPVDGTETGTGVKVSDPGDRFEREAAATAEAAMAGPAPAVSATTEAAGTNPGVQREEGEEEEELQGLFVQREAEDELEDIAP
ncbi:eCIS core domain-containing protein [Georgenia sp. MJ170]|uniref:eCIS core domain-containing protein n=1 Tax=Georgenia sunbinii TaxID=3117728 RepID=UPI002F26C360